MSRIDIHANEQKIDNWRVLHTTSNHPHPFQHEISTNLSKRVKLPHPFLPFFLVIRLSLSRFGFVKEYDSILPFFINLLLCLLTHVPGFVCRSSV